MGADRPLAIRTLRWTLALLAWLAFCAQLLSVAGSRGGPVRLSELRALGPRAGSFLEVDLESLARSASAVAILDLPEPWLEDEGDRRRAPKQLLAFIDDKGVAYQIGDPERPGESYVFAPGARFRHVSFKCAPVTPCREAVLVWPASHLRWWVWLRRVTEEPRGMLDTLSAASLSALVFAHGFAGWPRRRLAWLGLAPPLAAWWWFAFGLFWSGAAWTRALLALEAALAGAAALTAVGRGALLGVLGTRDESSFSRRLAALAAVCTLLAAPRLLLGIFWYPGASDDSLHYLFGASRVLAGGSFLEGALDPTRWVYSLYPVLIAGLATATGLHPMPVYRYVGLAGCILVPLAMSLFVWTATRRFRPALVACWVASLWGGLAGYLWLAANLPRLATGRWPRLIETDFFEPRFLGEFAGPYSDLTSYLAEVPFYPRDLGLALFWPGLALLYRGFPDLPTSRIAAFAAIAVLATSVYPYYGISAFVVLGFLAARAIRRSLRSRDRRAALLPMLALAAVAVVLVALGGLFVRSYRHVSLREYLVFLWERAPELEPARPALAFQPARLLGSHCFVIATLAAAAIAARRRGGSLRRLVRGWAPAPLVALGLASALAVGAAGLLSDRAQLLLTVYRWIVPWRSLAEPGLVLLASLALESLLRGPLAGRRVLAATLLLVPSLSPLFWTTNTFLYLEGGPGQEPFRGQRLYQEYSGYGSRLLGRVRIREPLLVEGNPGLLCNYTQAAFGVWDFENLRGPRQYLFEAAHEGRLRDLIRAGEIGDVAAHREGAFLRRIGAAGSVHEVARFGDFVVVRLKEAPG